MNLKRGLRFIYVGELERTPYAPDHRGLIQGMKWLKEDGVISEFKIVDPVLYPEKVVEECNSFNADVIVHGNTDSLNYDWSHHIKCGKHCFFMGDIQPKKEDYGSWNEWVKNGSGCFDAIFVSNRDQLKMWEEDFKAPAYFWPHGCYVPDKLEKGEEFHDLLFIGTMSAGGWYKTRYDLINRINELQKVDFLTKNDVEGRNEIWLRMPKLYHTANFVLDVSHSWDIDGYASGRYWYSGGLGACSLTKRFPGCEEFYENKKEKLYFDTAEEAKDLYDFYSSRPKDIEQIKYNAYERNKKDHTYRSRFLYLLEKLEIKL